MNITISSRKYATNCVIKIFKNYKLFLPYSASQQPMKFHFSHNFHTIKKKQQLSSNENLSKNKLSLLNFSIKKNFQHFSLLQHFKNQLPELREQYKDAQIVDNTFLDATSKEQNHKKNIQTYLVLLNQPLNLHITTQLFNLADLVIATDGAANRLYQLFDHHDQKQKLVLQKQYKPDMILGDLDSIKPETQKFYEASGVKFKKFDRQDDNDFEKALKVIEEKIHSENEKDSQQLQKQSQKQFKIIANGAFQGRLDQTLNNLSLMVKYTKKLDVKQKLNVNLMLLDGFSLALCMKKGKSIYKKSQSLEKTKGVGVLPLTQLNTGFNTIGLKWNIHKKLTDLDPFLFGNFMSSSNEFLDDELYFDTHCKFILTTSLKKFTNPSDIIKQ